MLWLWIGVVSAQQPSCVAVGGGWGCAEQLSGYTILDLHGTDTQIGHAYGALLRGPLRDAAVEANESVYASLPPLFRRIFLRSQARHPDYLDDACEARLAGVDAGAGLAPGTMRRYAWLADLSAIGPALQVVTTGAHRPEAPPAEGCTSLVDHAGGVTVHARNLDLWGMGFWQPHASLLFVDPRDEAGAPDGHRYAHVGTLGEVLAGTSGLNEAGLVVTSHLHLSRDVTLVHGRQRLSLLSLLAEGVLGRRPLPGTSIYTLFERTLRRAATVDQAWSLLEDARTVGAYSLVISDPGGDAAVIGLTQRGSSRTSARIQTNRYPDDALRSREMLPARGPFEGSDLRLARARQLLDGGLDVPRAIAALRDRHDLATGTQRAASPNTIASTDTSQSVVFVTRPDGAHRLWLSVPHDDGYTPAPFAPFVALSFPDGFSPGRRIVGTQPAPPPSPLDAQLGAYVDAMRLQLDVGDPQAAAERLRRMGTSDPAWPLMAAWLAASQGDLAQARRDLAQVERSGLDAHRRALAAWLDGELLAASGQRSEAVAAWRVGLQPDDDAPLAALLRAVLHDRIASGGRAARRLPAPDLKYQDVLALPHRD